MFKKLTQWYNHERHARALYASVLALVTTGVFLVVHAAWAVPSITEITNSIVSTIIQTITHFLGTILLLLIQILVELFKFGDFINTPAVQLGWVIIRDVANIGIVIALMVIAFSTVFKIKQYSASQLLVRLVIAAVLVNFSRLISGLIIDAGQVVMITFVHAFDKLAAGNLTVGFGIEDMLAVSTGPGSPELGAEAITSVISSILLAIAMLVVAIGTVLAFIVVLLQRIVLLWILIIFAPIAYVAPLLPGGSKWSGQWWSNFSKQVIIGPVLAFGFWLSMSILSSVSANQHLIRLKADNVSNTVVEENSIAFFASKISTPQAVFDYMVVIALLLGTLWMAQQAGGAAGGFAGSVQSKLKSGGKAAVRAPFRAAATITGAKYASDVYKSYKGNREAIRKQNVSEAGARVSALRDSALPSVETTLGGKKGRERVAARVKQETLARTQREMQNADQAHDLYDQSTEGLQQILDGTDDKKVGKSQAARRQAATLLAQRGDGLGKAADGGKRTEKALSEFAGITKLGSDLTENIKKSSSDAAYHSSIYDNVANTTDAAKLKSGSSKVLGDVVNGTLDGRDLNNHALYQQLELGQQEVENEKGVKGEKNVLKTLTEKSRNSDQFEKIAKAISNEKVKESMAMNNRKGLGEDIGDDMRLAVSRRGFQQAAWGDLNKEENRDRMNEAWQGAAHRREASSNIVKGDLKEDRVAEIVSANSSGGEMKKLFEDKGTREAISEGFTKVITRYDNDDSVVDKYYGEDVKDGGRKGYNTIHKVRRNQMKATRDFDKAYTTGDVDAYVAFENEMSTGNLRGEHLEFSNLVGDEQLAASAGHSMSSKQIAELAESDSKKGIQTKTVMENVENKQTRKALQRNPVTAGKTPDSWPTY